MFHTWQQEVSRNLDSKGQVAVTLMPQPDHYPVMLNWLAYEEIDGNGGMGLDISDRFEHSYTYPDDFPHKELKTGVFVYQVIRTSERFEHLMES